jgi:glutamate synthase domain-containing protein 3
VPLDEVEPWTAVVRRFKTGAMSYGSLSSEAHEALAVAMNRVGGKSNTGEGGEPPPRYARSHPARSAIKQVASGRFGVTIAYLADADEIQIKMAQGAKPGEGGQLPAPKVLPWIAETRHATPFVGLISPPPHHDIYSIEDLAQLIHDLKAATPSARVSVKLVSEVGVGTVAAGVAKAGADTILISGADGGTGAAALTSVAHAGAPWELGLAEAHQALVATGLRSRVRLETDGHLKTGRDVAVAALLGADEFGFATAPLVALGCVMMRKCHLNVCPVGIATQDPALRALFAGEPEHVVNYVHFVAEGLRRHMAALGFRTVAEMVGRVESLRASDAAAARGLDLAPLLARAETPDVLVACGCLAAPAPGAPGPAAGHPDAVAMGTVPGAVEGRARLDLALPVRNLDRAVGTHLSGAMARHALRTGRAHAPDSITLRLAGSAGQSLGAFGAPGLTIHLEGDANDYVGKGLSGARLILRPPEASPFRAEAQVLLGNVALYGATSGELYARGRAGERFAVRNSGATAVVEGAGDHACEYMTGGTVIVLGPTGRNACAGMSGGQAFFYDPDGAFRARFAGAAADLDGLAPESAHAELLWQTVARHAALTGSALAHALLDDWPAALARFVLVLPAEYRAALERQAAPERVRAEESAAERPMAPAPAAAPAPTLRGRAA